MLSSRPSHHASRSTLARSYEQEGVELDDDDRDKLQMLDSYMASVEDAGADAPAPEEEDPADLPMPTKIEDVDAFMARRRAQTLAVGRQRPRQQCPARAPGREAAPPSAPPSARNPARARRSVSRVRPPRSVLVWDRRSSWLPPPPARGDRPTRRTSSRLPRRESRLGR